MNHLLLRELTKKSTVFAFFAFFVCISSSHAEIRMFRNPLMFENGMQHEFTGKIGNVILRTDGAVEVCFQNYVVKPNDQTPSVLFTDEHVAIGAAFFDAVGKNATVFVNESQNVGIIVR